MIYLIIVRYLFAVKYPVYLLKDITGEEEI